ncbi:MAG: complex I NDUFA9 subunit family protein [Firmicutes bacterium]|nr:complex I NDUFA9 subunit family protein [Bacillota bacterium]
MILVTGATGFLGRHVMERLVRGGQEVRGLARRVPAGAAAGDGGGSVGRATGGPADDGIISWVPGDIRDRNVLRRAAEGCRAVVHLVGIIKPGRDPARGYAAIHVEGTRNVVDAAASAGVGRFVYISAAGAGPDAETPYHRSKWEAEEIVRLSGFPHLILRPSVVYGPGGELTEMLAGMARRMPLLPVPGSGNYRIQPVYVQDVAESVAVYCGRAEAEGGTYELGGPEAVTYEGFLVRVMEALGKRRARIHVPLALLRPAIRVMEKTIPSLAPLTSEQLTMLLAGSLCPETPRLAADLGLTLTPLDRGLRESLAHPT